MGGGEGYLFPLSWLIGDLREQRIPFGNGGKESNGKCKCEQQIPRGNDRKKCNGKSKGNGKSKSNGKCKCNRRSFDFAALRSG